MAFIVLVIDVPGESIGTLNANQNSGNPHEAVSNAQNLLNGIQAGAVDASIQMTVRDTDPSVATSGAGSTQESYNLK